MSLRCGSARARAEHAPNLALHAPLPGDEVDAAGDLEAQCVLAGVQDAVEIREDERVERRG